jgi:hypothetical protein
VIIDLLEAVPILFHRMVFCMGALRFFRSMFFGHLVVSMLMSSCGVPVSYSYSFVVLVFLFLM